MGSCESNRGWVDLRLLEWSGGPERPEAGSRSEFWGMNIPCRGTSKCKGPEKGISWHIQGTQQRLEHGGQGENRMIFTHFFSLFYKYLWMAWDTAYQRTGSIFPTWTLYDVICVGSLEASLKEFGFSAGCSVEFLMGFQYWNDILLFTFF